MKNIILLPLIFFISKSYAQEINVLLKQAVNYERALKEDSALLKYKSILAADSGNIVALLKVSLLNASFGSRQSTVPAKLELYNNAKYYADKALLIDSTNCDANYARGLAALDLSSIETENKKLVILLREAFAFANRSIKYNSNHGKSNFLMGIWNFNIVNTAWTKKAAVKVLYGGIPDASIENAILYMDKCKTSEPYFVLNFLELAKAYKFNNNPSKAIEILNLLVKLPNRTPDDAMWKAEGKKILSEMQ